MVVYKVFHKNYELRKGEFVGLLAERRKNLRGSTLLESGLRWARAAFGREVIDERAIFIVPDELMAGSNTEWLLMEKGVFHRVDLLGVMKSVVKEMENEREETSSI
jgi:hypothetical protein